MDVQAKDRLTGAVILVALLVLLVPEILSGPAHSGSAVADQTTGETALRSYSVDLGEVQRAPATNSAAAPGAADSSEQGSVSAEASAPALPATAAPQSHAETSTPAPVIPTGPAAATQAPAAATTRAAPVRPVAMAAKPAAAPAMRGAWTVQLGTFSSQANADRLVHELQGKGFAAFSTERASGGRKLYRVRVGPASDHAGAVALAARLRSAGHTGSLTEHP